MWKYWWNESQNIYHLSQGQDIKRLITLISEGLGMYFFSLQIWSLWDHFYFDLFEPPTKSVEPLSNISEKTGMMVHRIASFDQLHWWTTIENHQTQWWGTQKPSENHRSSMVSPNHSIQWWWLLWKPPTFKLIKPARETAVTPERKVKKSLPRWEINRHVEG